MNLLAHVKSDEVAFYSHSFVLNFLQHLKKFHLNKMFRRLDDMLKNYICITVVNLFLAKHQQHERKFY